MLPDIVCVYQSDKMRYWLKCLLPGVSFILGRSGSVVRIYLVTDRSVEFAMKLDLRGFLFFGRGVTNRS